MYRCYIATSKKEGKDWVSYQLHWTDKDDEIPVEQMTELWKEDKLADHSFVMDELRKIVGGVLTIIDASVPEGKQNKAIKDLVRKLVSESMGHTTKMMVDQRPFENIGDDMTDEELENMEAVDVLEAIGVDENKR